jgi:hypothetical protein
MADAFMMGSIVVGVLNVVLTSLLLAVYGGVYGKTKAPFTRGLLLFAAAFLSHNVLVVYAYLTMMPLVPEALNPFLLGIGAFEAAGLGSILWTATR